MYNISVRAFFTPISPNQLRMVSKFCSLCCCCCCCIENDISFLFSLFLFKLTFSVSKKNHVILFNFLIFNLLNLSAISVASMMDSSIGIPNK